LAYWKIGALIRVGGGQAATAPQTAATVPPDAAAIEKAVRAIQAAGNPRPGARSEKLDQIAGEMAQGILPRRQMQEKQQILPGDPYAGGQQMLAKREYQKAKALLVERVARAEFASRCGVIPKVLVDTIARSGMNFIARAELNAGRSNYHPDLLLALRATALDVAKMVDGEPGRCDYWHQNPEAVAQMRSEAQLSVR
jgi:hypothetical protein